MSANNLQLPGTLTPGRPQRFSNIKTTEYNDLVKAAMIKPALIDATAKYFTYKCGVLSQLLMYMGKNFSPSMLNEGMVSDSKKMMLKNAFKFIDNYQFAYKVASPGEKLLEFTRDPFPVQNLLGKGGKFFKVWINTETINKDDIILLDDLETQLMVIAPPVRHERDTELTVRLQIRNSNHSIPYAMVKKGRQALRHSNMKSERSTSGSRFDVTSNDMATEWMTTYRFETDASGHAAAMKGNKMWFVYTSPDGREESLYWIDQFEYMMIEKSWEFIENSLWNGVSARNADGSFYKDPKSGKEYISGNGLVTQANAFLNKTYNNFSRSFFEEIVYDLRVDAIGNTTSNEIDLVFMGGFMAQQEFNSMIEKEFNGKHSATPFFYDMNGVKGYESRFNVLRLPFANIYMAPTEYFDQKHMPKRFDKLGKNINSHTSYLLNISELYGGLDNVSLVTMPGRDMKRGTVNGMSNPGPNGVLSTTEDVEGIHLLRTAGIAVHNPNCLAKISKSYKYM